MKKFLLLLLLILLTGCQSVTIKDFDVVGPTTGNIGSVITLSIDIDEEVIWSSSNPEVAEVNDNGELTLHSVGHTFITATLVSDESISKTIVFTVSDEPKVPEEPEEPNEPTEPQDPDNNESNHLFYHTKILSINQEMYEMELLDVPYTKYANNLKINQKINNQILPIPFSSLNIGMENVYVAVNKETKEIESLLVDGEIGFSNIRVAIRNKIDNIANEDDIYHSSIKLLPKSNLLIKSFDGEDSITANANQQIDVNISNGVILVSSSGRSLMTEKRIIFVNSGNIQVTSITRGTSSSPEYAGNMEVSIVGTKLLLVNDVNLESYLTKVVPSEMPSSFHSEALKAQAVAARTYAYADIFNKSNIKYGYTVDDSVKSQVYNNQNPNSNTTNAVINTKGMIMTHNNQPINAFYYSTSSGLTATSNEVWISSREQGELIPYLIGQNLTKSGGNLVEFDYQDEGSMLAFYKLIKLDTPDNNSLFHRWRTTMTAAQLKNTLTTNLKISYAANPSLVLTKDGNSWVSTTIPSNIGEILNVYVSKRGSSGVVIELDIETTTHTFKLVNQYTIRFTIRPMNAGTNVVTDRARNTDSNYTNKANNISILYSGFFAIEKIGNTYSFYGGGNGHGVGMSQYGASGLGSQGKNYTQILTTYYSDVDLTDIGYTYQYNSDAISSLKKTI